MAKYSKEIVKKICSLIKADSYTIAEICQIVGISEDTYYDWMNKKSEFSESIKKAKKTYDEFIVSEAKKSLFKLSAGYSVEETKIEYIDDPKNPGKPKIKSKTTATKHIQPSLGANIFILTNKDPENWKNKQNTDITTAGEKIEFKGFNFLPYTPEADEE